MIMVVLFFSKEQLERIKAYQDGTLKSSATFNEQSRRWNYYTGSNDKYRLV